MERKDNYREVPDEKIVDVPDTPAFGRWKDLFSPKATTHPAKMNQNLLRYLLERYTAPGEVVLDPMSGTGATGVQAALLGRHGVCVEYEKWMVDVAQETVERVGKHSQVTPKGTMTMIHGDARELSRVVRSAPIDAAVFSPPYAGPYAEEHSKASGGKFVPVMDEARLRRWWENYRSQGGGMSYEAFIAQQRRWRWDYKGADAVITSPPHSESVGTRAGGKMRWTPEDQERRANERVTYSEDPDNIGNKPHGDIDAVVLSPPSERDAEPHSEIHEKGRGPVLPRPGYDAVITSPPHADTQLTQSKNILTPRNPIGKVDPAAIERGGYDAVVTSPPYAEANRGGGIAKKGYKGEHGDDPGLKDRHDRALSDDAGNISNAPYGDVDAIVTSPPYEDAKAFQQDLSEAFVGEMRRRTREGITGGKPSSVEAEVAHLERAAEGRRTTEGNIGRKSGETYLEAMARVYRECHQVLKPGGIIVVVVKNFVRGGKPVRLDEDTRKLLRWAGFEEVDHLYRKLRGKSFWIRNMERKFRKGHPGEPLPTTNFEDILIFRRPPA